MAHATIRVQHKLYSLVLVLPAFAPQCTALLHIIIVLMLNQHTSCLTLLLCLTPAVGRNMDEIVRVVDALMLSADKSVATPANWPNNHEEAGMKGWVFLLPTVTKEDAATYFPEHKVCDVPSGQGKGLAWHTECGQFSTVFKPSAIASLVVICIHPFCGGS